MKVIIITGASKGFGRALAICFATNLSEENLHFYLSARSTEELECVRDEILQLSSERYKVHLCSVDLGDIDNLSLSSDRMLGDYLQIWKEADEIIYIANAGSLGNLAPIGSTSFNPVNISSAIDLNITSYCYLTSDFLRRAKELSRVLDHSITIKIVNISSLAALQAFESWSIYCAGKAARDMFYQALAKELNVAMLNNVKVLNYAPGPLDTDMQREIRENPEVDAATRAFYKQMKENNQLIEPTTSAEKLIQLLFVRNDWKSGSHIDYYDA